MSDQAFMISIVTLYISVGMLGYNIGSARAYKNSMKIMCGDYSKAVAIPVEEKPPAKKNPMGFIG